MKKVFAIAGVALILAVIVVANLRVGDRGAVSVQTQEVRRGRITHVVTASGNIEAGHSVDLSADVAGKITRLLVHEGDLVTEGDTLLLIDPAPYEADVAAERASLATLVSEMEQARRDLERSRRVFETGERGGEDPLISREEIERLETAYEVARQKVEGARAAASRAEEYLKKTSVTAPIAGMVTRLNVEQGEVAIVGTMNNPGTVLLTVSDLSTIEVAVRVDETDVVDIATGQTVEIRIDAFPDETFRGVVSEIGSSPIGGSAFDQAVDFLVKAALIDPPAKVKVGLSATAEITTATRESALVIPIQAVAAREVAVDEEGDGSAGVAATGAGESSRSPGVAPTGEGAGDGSTVASDGKMAERKGVFLVADGVAKFTPVVTGIMGGMEVEVLDGLAEGDEVVIGSYKVLRTLESGTRVRVDDSSGAGREEE